MRHHILSEIESDVTEKIYVQSNERIGDVTSSKGNQMKWYSCGKYIKLNCLGYESVAECLVSWFLKFTNLKPNEYVTYKACVVYEDGKCLGLGCYSEDFLNGGDEVTVKDILSANVMSFSISYDDLRDFLFDIVKFDVKPYFDKILCLDSITRNDDRHFDNISFIYRDGVFRPAPIFDNGGACMSDLIMYPMSVDFDTNYKSILAKPFRTNFVSQLQNVDKLVVDYDSFFNSVALNSAAAIRALEVLKRGLKETEGIAWERS